MNIVFEFLQFLFCVICIVMLLYFSISTQIYICEKYKPTEYNWHYGLYCFHSIK